MVELWIRPFAFADNREKLFPLLLAKFSPPIADALEECELIAMELSRHSNEYYFDVEVLQRTGTAEWYRFFKGKKEVMRNFRGEEI